MHDIRHILEPFAKSIRIKSAAIADDALNLTKSQRARFIESVDDDIKKCSNFFTPEVSEAASKEAAKRGVDLFSRCWHDQHQFDPKREIFHFEHMTPVNHIRKRCLSCATDEEICDVLMSLRVTWILKAEDGKLTQLGYRSKRPDPDAAYLKADIKLLRPDSPNIVLRPTPIRPSSFSGGFPVGGSPLRRGSAFGRWTMRK